MNMKERLAAGECLIGAGIYSNSLEVMEFAAAGMDWIWWETQHTHADWPTMVHAVRTAYAMRIPVLVRTWTHDCGTIEKLLDTGAEGIIVPMVETAGQAREIVAHCYYPPAGCRSYGSIRTECVEPDVEAWNRRVVSILMIETPEAVANAEAIAAVPGVDGLLVGARDLSLRHGEVADVPSANAAVADDLSRVLEACRNTGKVSAIIATTPEDLSARVREGHRLICAGMDLDHVKACYQHMRDAFANALRAESDEEKGVQT